MVSATIGVASLCLGGAGIALAALLLFGYRLWPGIALGAFLINASTGIGLAVAAGIAAGSTLGALAGTYLLRRLTRFREPFERPQNVLVIVALAVAIATWHTARHVDPFASPTLTESLLLLQIFVSVVAV